MVAEIVVLLGMAESEDKDMMGSLKMVEQSEIVVCETEMMEFAVENIRHVLGYVFAT